jgi:hypothetical protein
MYPVNEVSAVLARGVWYMGIPAGRHYAVFAIEKGKARRIGAVDYSEGDHYSLTRTRTGDAVAVMAERRHADEQGGVIKQSERRARIHRLDEQSGRIGAAEPVEWVAPNALPPPCPSNARGWLRTRVVRHPVSGTGVPSVTMNGKEFRVSSVSRQTVYTSTGACTHS